MDKDLASGLLAHDLGADMLLIPTAVPRVAIRFGKPDQQWLDTITVDEARAYIEAGEFGAGSMEPKVAAVADFVASHAGRGRRHRRRRGDPGDHRRQVRDADRRRRAGGGCREATDAAPTVCSCRQRHAHARTQAQPEHDRRAGATFVRETTTEPAYRLWTINDDHPAMVRVTDGSGVAVAVEVWSVPAAGLAGILLDRAARADHRQSGARRRLHGARSPRRAGLRGGPTRDHQLRRLAGLRRDPVIGALQTDASGAVINC